MIDQVEGLAHVIEALTARHVFDSFSSVAVGVLPLNSE
jgi:hypothetical protein